MFTDTFLSNVFVEGAAATVGDRWFVLGLFFGLQIQELECHVQNPQRTEKVHES